MKVLEGPIFNPRVPSIYQIEAHSACQLKCPMCPRFVEEKHRDDFALSVDLARTIAERDLDGSYFIEFQMSGEPLLNKKLSKIVEPFLGKVITGMSTNGLLIHKHIDLLLELDYLTISVDSVRNYEKIRVNGTFVELEHNISLLMQAKTERKSKVQIDLQVIDMDNEVVKNNAKEEAAELQEIVDDLKWDCEVRIIKDSSTNLYTQQRVEASKELCLNPWLSVSVHSDGDVVPCCMAFGKEVIFGNLNESSLEEIWNNSKAVKEFRAQHLSGCLPDMCAKCTTRSPALLHQSIFNNIVRRNKV